MAIVELVRSNSDGIAFAIETRIFSTESTGPVDAPTVTESLSRLKHKKGDTMNKSQVGSNSDGIAFAIETAIMIVY